MRVSERLQLWGGVECTVNRVADSYFDQLAYSGHADRITDLDLIADLGVKVVRYPVLWEKTETGGSADFSWADGRLTRLRELGVEPIAGLLHHGSGPEHTSLVHPCFTDKFANYARRVAERYPWLSTYTPVNEPLTTARFSGLYGHWYPHGRDDRTFVRALINQCRATARAMAAVRSVNPRAKLMQTEDMGFTRSTDELAYQADFENERRWLSLDLLAGRVRSGHPLFSYLLRYGATEHELATFAEAPCPPDIIGINYYVTSERFLDGRIALYPPSTVGGNGRSRYADVEAVRVCLEGLVGPAELLISASERYKIPVAITEAHLGCTPAQQASWLAYVWEEANSARRRGANVLAVTAWALFGTYGWDRLVTAGRGTYESGVFDMAAGQPAETALASCVRSLAAGQGYRADAGWWAVPERIKHPPYIAGSRAA